VMFDFLVNPPGNILLLLGGLGLIWWDLARSRVLEPAAPVPVAEPVPVPVSVQNAPAPVRPTTETNQYYTTLEVDRILEALFDITTLLQEKGIPARDAAEQLLRIWNSTLGENKQTEFRDELKRVRLMFEEVNNGGWSISNKYQHYNTELGPILGGMSFAEKYFGASNRFVDALDSLPPVIDARTLNLLLPMRNEYHAALEVFKQWVAETYDRARAATDRFRRIERRAGSELATSKVPDSRPSAPPAGFGFFSDRDELARAYGNLAKRFEGHTNVSALWVIGIKFYDDGENLGVIKKLLLPNPNNDALKYLVNTVQRKRSAEFIKDVTKRAKANGTRVRWYDNFIFHSIILADVDKPEGWMHVESVLPHSRIIKRPSYTVFKRHSPEAVAEMQRVFDCIWEDAKDAPG
jgi:hypothetical protein